MPFFFWGGGLGETLIFFPLCIVTTSRAMSRTKCGLYMSFVDLIKVFERAWKMMAKFRCPPMLLAMVRQFHDGIQARVQNDGEYFKPFR